MDVDAFAARRTDDLAGGARRVYRTDPAGLSILRQWLDPFRECAVETFQQERTP